MGMLNSLDGCGAHAKTSIHSLKLYILPIHENTIVNTTTTADPAAIKIWTISVLLADIKNSLASVKSTVVNPYDL